MKKTLIAFALLLSTSSLLNAQIETFDLSTFKLPKIKRQSLNFVFGANNQNTLESWKDTADYSYNENMFYAQTNLNGSYFLYINTPNQQSSYSLYSSIYFYPYDGANINEDDFFIESERTTRFSYSIYGSTSNLIYFQNPFFIEFRPSIRFARFRNINKNIEEDENGNPLYDYYSKSLSGFFDATVEFGAGYGRIEPIDDAQMALFILNDLKKENRLIKEPTHDEIYQLAEIISINRNKRFFDNRLKVIEDIKAIDSYLVANGIVSQTDATYFTTIYDNWLYANTPFRESGFRFSLGPSIGNTINTSFYEWEAEDFVFDVQNDFKSEYKQSQLYIGGWANIIYEKPISLTWQRSLYASLNYQWANAISKQNDDPETEKNQNNVNAELGIAWGYYPNTRTYFDLEIRIGGQINESDRYFTLPDDNSVDRVDFKNAFISPSLSGYYYFSPKLRLSLNTSVNYNLYKTDNFSLLSPPFTGFGFGYVNANRLSKNFLIGINYAIF